MTETMKTNSLLSKTNESYPIDAIVPWVDANDPAWQEIRSRHANEGRKSTSDDNEARYRDWDTLRYVFRGIEQNMPWIRTVHFVTMNQIPEWLNTMHSKLNIINHSDYIPQEYLPTFSSHTIQLNYHRIPELAEHFICFNDDVLAMRPCKRTDFFLNGLPRDMAIHRPLIGTHRGSVLDSALTNTEIINDYFDKHTVIRKNFWKWYTPVYGKNVLNTILLSPYNRFSYIKNLHMAQPLLKSTCKHVWELEYEKLNDTCLHKFRTRRDVSDWIFHDWQIASGQFIPVRRSCAYYVMRNDNRKTFAAIKKNKHSLICVNDVAGEEITDFENVKKELRLVLESILPEKCTFER